MDRRLLGFLFILASAAGFGSGAVFAKGVYATGVDWVVLMAWRFLIGAGATWLWILGSSRRRADVRRLSRRAVAVGLGLGVLYVGNSGTYYAGLEGVSASLAALIVFVYPALVAVLSLRIGRRLEGRRAWTALAIALVGSALTIGGIEAGSAPEPAYLLLVAASPVIYAFWIVLQARLSGERPGRVAHDAVAVDGGNTAAAVAGLVSTGAAVCYWIVAIGTARPVGPASVPAAAWPGIVGIGFLSTFVAILGFVAGSHLIGAAQASLISTIEPVWTVALASVVLGETLTPVQLLGGALILIGVVIAQTASVPGAPGRDAGSARTVLRIADE
jgi:drug/metabolite transporter (DMT)-like permease